MPTNYGGFRERVKVLKIREAIAALDRIKSLPSRGNVEPGEIPYLSALGVNPNASIAQVLDNIGRGCDLNKLKCEVIPVVPKLGFKVN